MDVVLSPATLSGEISAIPSKSAAHRVFIAASLADRPSRWALPTSSVDIDTTLACMEAFGASIHHEDGWVDITPIATATDSGLIDCEESGSTFRFLLPIAAALGGRYDFVGRGRLPERPIADYLEVLSTIGAKTTDTHLPFTMEGPLTGGQVSLPGNVSSQYITGLLLAAPLLHEDLDITITTALESRPYVDLSLSVLKKFGIEVQETGNHFHISADAHYTVAEGDQAVEGDWSNAAFFLAAGALSAPVTMRGLDLNSSQGDKAIIPILKNFGAQVDCHEDGSVTVSPAALKAQTISVKEIPDSLPILAVVAAHAEGTTVFTDAERLRLKESDRLMTTAAFLEAMGVHCEATDSTFSVTGVPQLRGNCTVDSANDHRIAMAAAIAALNCDGPVTLTCAQAVNKSYPHFYSDYEKLGGDCHVI